MASSLYLFAMFLAHLVSAATLQYDFNVTWVNANPDGQITRPVIGINGKWPPPILTFTRGDQIIAKVHNSLGNESVSIHWHGLLMKGSNNMDGLPGVSQCDIPPGKSFVHNFTVNQSGTYWYHSHSRGQYPDGIRQALIIKDPKDPYREQYDEERVITLSDWYHEQMPTMLKRYISPSNPTGIEPVPNSALMNDSQNLTVAVEPGKTYLFHLINVGAFASQYFWIEGHTMKIVQVDGIWTEMAETNMLYMASAQRYSVLVTMKSLMSQNYAMVGSMDKSLFERPSPTLNNNVTGWLVYDDDSELPTPANITEYNPYDDMKLIPYDREPLIGEANHTITLNITMHTLEDGANYAFLNNITYVAPKVPTLYTALSSGLAANDPRTYEINTNPFVLQKWDIVDIVLNNDDKGLHPFHIHGHAFQVIVRSPKNFGHYNASNPPVLPAVPLRRDTAYVESLGHLVLRFRADNPGAWFLHCHMEWHMDAGLAMTIIEAPLELQKSLRIPDEQYRICNTSGTQISGHVAGEYEGLV